MAHPGETDPGVPVRWEPGANLSGPNLTGPSLARVHDHALGGQNNYQVDRDLHAQILEINPEFDAFVRGTRRFLVQSLQRMADAGIDQYIALGTGLPTTPSVHEVVRRTHPHARVVYVEAEPIAATHARALLARERDVVAVRHRLDDCRAIVGDPAVTALLDLTRPLGVCFGLIQVVPHPSALAVMAFHREQLASGSMIGLHALLTEAAGFRGEPGGRPQAAPPFDDEIPPIVRAASQIVFRTREQVAELFRGLDVLGPGLVDLASWARLPLPPGVDGPALPGLPSSLHCLAGLARLP